MIDWLATIQNRLIDSIGLIRLINASFLLLLTIKNAKHIRTVMLQRINMEPLTKDNKPKEAKSQNVNAES